MSDYKDPVIEAVEHRLACYSERLLAVQSEIEGYDQHLENFRQQRARYESDIAKMRGFLRVYNPEAPGATCDGGWIPWSGGECPVPPDTLVEIACGKDRIFVHKNRAKNLIWSHDAGEANIVKYRIADTNRI